MTGQLSKPTAATTPLANHTPRHDATAQILVQLLRVAAGCNQGRIWNDSVAHRGLAHWAIANGLGGCLATACDREMLRVSDRCRRTLAAHALRDRAHNERRLAYVAQLCGEAENRGLKLLPLKGTALMMNRPYNATDMRTLSDIDLLTHWHQLAPLKQLIVEAGWRLVSGHQQQLRHHHHLQFVRSEPAQDWLELHWTPFNSLHSRAAEDDAAVDRALLHRFRNQSFWQLTLEDTLVGLLLHLGNHRFMGQAKWLLDILLLIQNQSLCWQTVWRQAERIGAIRACRHTLTAIGNLTRVRPASSLYAANRRRDGAWYRRTPEIILDTVAPHRPTPATPARLGWARGLLIHTLLHDEVSAAVRHGLFKLSEVAERHGFQLPDNLTRVYVQQAGRCFPFL